MNHPEPKTNIAKMVEEEVSKERKKPKGQKKANGRKGKKKSKAKKENQGKARKNKKPEVTVPEVAKPVEKKKRPEVDPSKVLVVSNHHRRIGYFDSTMEMLHKDGFHILLHDTSEKGSVAFHPAAKFHTPNVSYDQGMVALKKKVDQRIHNDGYQYILLIDNDCFLTGTDHLKEMLKAFRDGDFDFASHCVDPADSVKYHKKNDDLLVEVKDQRVDTCTQPPGIIPVPHWENSFSLIKADLWRSLPEGSFGHSRKWFAEMHKQGAKFGSHKAEYKTTYTQHGKQWFHMGNLMAYIYAIENNQIDKFSADSEMSMGRLGFLFECNRKFVDHWPPEFQHAITAAVHTHGLERAQEAWQNLKSGTCMENY